MIRQGADIRVRTHSDPYGYGRKIAYCKYDVLLKPVTPWPNPLTLA
jgi:hypothetical protein